MISKNEKDFLRLLLCCLAGDGEMASVTFTGNDADNIPYSKLSRDLEEKGHIKLLENKKSHKTIKLTQKGILAILYD